MNRGLKVFLRAVAEICLWGGPLLALLGLIGALLGAFDVARIAVVGATAAYVVVASLLVGGVLRLLLSIDDRLERIERIR